MDNTDKPMYGVWIPRSGWLRIKDDVFADFNPDKAAQVAKHAGGQVRFIDPSIVELEPLYLEREGRNLWKKLTSLLSNL